MCSFPSPSDFAQTMSAAAGRSSAKKAVIPSDERKRVAATFKDFCEPGTSKVSLSELPALVKELAKGPAAADPQVKKLISLAKEALMAKCAGGPLGSGDFINWYFEVAWEELKPAATVKPPATVERPDRKRPGQKPAANKSANAEGGKHVAGVDAGGAGGISDAPEASSAAPAPAHPSRPHGWELGEGVQVDEYRRLLQLCCQFQRPTGARGLIPASQLQPLLQAALRDDADLLPEVLTSLPSPERQSSSDDEPALPVGVLIKLWFDEVLPRVVSQRQLLESEAHAAVSPRT